MISIGPLGTVAVRQKRDAPGSLTGDLGGLSDSDALYPVAAKGNETETETGTYGKVVAELSEHMAKRMKASKISCQTM